jgi:DNA topoisomerase-3
MVKELTEQVKSQGYQAKKTACPKCEIGHLIRGKSAWGCSDWKKGCKFTLPYEYKGITINDNEMLELLHKGETRYSYIFNKKKPKELKKIIFTDKLKLGVEKVTKE